MACDCSIRIGLIERDIRILEARNRELKELIRKYKIIDENAIDIREYTSDINGAKLKKLYDSLKLVRLSGKSFDKNDLQIWRKSLSNDVMKTFYSIHNVCLKYINKYNAEIDSNNKSIASKRASIATINANHSLYHVVHEDYSGGGGLKGKGWHGPR